MLSDRPNSLSFKQLLKPHWKALSLGFAAVTGVAVADLLQPWPLKVVLDNVLRNKPGQGWLNHALAHWVGDDKLALLRFAAGAVLVIAIFDALCSYGEKYVTTSVGQWVMHDLRRTVYSHIQRLSLAYHDQKRTGDLISRVTTDIDAVQTLITSGLLSVIVNAITLVGMVCVMFYLNWRFTLVALSVAPVLAVLVYSFTRRIKKASRELRKKEGEIVSTIQEVITSIRVVRAFAREDYEQRRLEAESLEGVDMALKARSLKAKLSPLVQVTVAVGTCLVLWFGGRMVLAGTLSPGSLVIFILYLGKMYKPMQELSKMTDAYSKATVGYERIRELLDTTGEVLDKRGAKNAPPLKGDLEFRNVSFHYNPDQPILKNVSFHIRPGQVAAFVGPTGAGKSTIATLIPRFYDPVSGDVFLDGMNIRDLRQKTLRQQISFVLQETVLFHIPIWQNIAYGKPEATREQILQAAELANAHEFIEKMPEGYDTMVGERGVTLSGGQRQRIAIARAVIRNSPILIMDEPSSGLDAASEKLVFDALEKLMQGKTAIIIAHRLATIRHAAVIFVLKDGEIVEQGTHDELCELHGEYSELYKIQFEQAEDSELVKPAQA